MPHGLRTARVAFATLAAATAVVACTFTPTRPAAQGTAPTGLSLPASDTTAPDTAPATTATATTPPSTTPSDTTPSDTTALGTAPGTTAPDTTAPDTTPSGTTAPDDISGGRLALDELALVTVEKEHLTGYVRDLFGYPADFGHGCDTRAMVLRRDSLRTPVVKPRVCTVVWGEWISVYDGRSFAAAADVEIDHVVALKEAWDSGAWAWGSAKRHAFANDIVDVRTLRAVSTTSNRAKGDKDPSNWLPPNTADVCSYVGDWVTIKVRWGLSMDQSEFGRIRNLLKGPCAGLRVADFVAIPAGLG